MALLNDDELSVQARQIFATLANEDAMRIFTLASKGIQASRDALEENDFTKKRYYVRLGELVDIGLVAKEKGVYGHTPLGSIVYESQVASLKRILAKSESLEILGELRSGNRSDQILKNAVTTLSQHLLKEVEASIGLSNLKPVRLFSTWNDFFAQTSLIIDSAKSDVFIGTRTFDAKIAREALKAAERGCFVDIIHNRVRELNPSDKAQQYQEEILDLLNALRAHPNARLRRESLPYSFFVSDKTSVAMEVPHPGEESFFLGIAFQNPEIAAILSSHQAVKLDSPVIGGVI
ncbi:MAG: hypothetical protein JRN20_09930 [Nitrososphaerota archaeon]|nr:hypothetical protein [Nitrososphaerota archaeon]MDG6923765.1 hypothetical protein [Nitrososphaerota archaeon]